MNIDQLAAQLEIDEGRRKRMYLDSVGKWTVGVGRNMSDRDLSDDEIDLMRNNDIKLACADLDRALPWWRFMTENRQQVLTNMCFNMGLGDSKRGLLSFRNTLNSMQTGDYKAAAQGMLNSTWAKQVGARADRLAKMMREG